MQLGYDSLTVLLPASGDAAQLERRIAELLDVLPDLTPSFEILIVSGGGDGDAEELAHEMSRIYPQLRVLPQAYLDHPELGLQRANGDVVLPLDPARPVKPVQLRQMWEVRSNRQLIMASDAEETTLMERLKSWASRLPESHVPIAEVSEPRSVKPVGTDRRSEPQVIA